MPPTPFCKLTPAKQEHIRMGKMAEAQELTKRWTSPCEVVWVCAEFVRVPLFAKKSTVDVWSFFLVFKGVRT